MSVKTADLIFSLLFCFPLLLGAFGGKDLNASDEKTAEAIASIIQPLEGNRLLSILKFFTNCTLIDDGDQNRCIVGNGMLLLSFT